MNKSYAIKILGGTPTHVARAIGVSVQAVASWPTPLTAAIEDRVCAAYMRKIGIQMPKETNETTAATAVLG